MSVVTDAENYANISGELLRRARVDVKQGIAALGIAVVSGFLVCAHAEFGVVALVSLLFSAASFGKAYWLSHDL